MSSCVSFICNVKVKLERKQKRVLGKNVGSKFFRRIRRSELP
jgi:hypothetical protein